MYTTKINMTIYRNTSKFKSFRIFSNSIFSIRISDDTIDFNDNPVNGHLTSSAVKYFIII